MALTFNKQYEGVHGNQSYWQGSITFDSSYPTGGEAITAADFGLSQIDHVMCTTEVANKQPAWDRTNSKIKIFAHTSGAEAANASDQSATVITITVHGR